MRKKQYPNLFEAIGYDKAVIEERINQIIHTIFYGSEKERLYHPVGNDMGYFLDTGNLDVRTEGMSYGMMICVQRDMQEEFNRIWKWTKTYMWHSAGIHKGYFAWSVSPEGKRNAEGAAPDGEEYFAMALFFAAHRWGDGEGIFNYTQEARSLLHECVHKGENGIGKPMWEPTNKLIKFVAELDFTDPSYHLPHFYELFALWANEEDREFWHQAAKASRDFLKKACHEETGLAPEYSSYEGIPRYDEGHGYYYSDSYRVIGNIALDYIWFGEDEWESQCADKLQHYFCETVKDKPYCIYEVDGTIIDEPALHPVAIIATNAMGSLAAKGKYKELCVQKLWDTPLRTGDRRYYDNCLYAFAFLALSGNYRIWE